MPSPHPLPPGRAALALTTFLACTPRPIPEASTTDNTSPTETTTRGTTTTPPSPTSTSETTATTASLADTTSTSLPEATTGVPFIVTPDGGGTSHQECDGLKQLQPECPDGQKCTLDGAFGSTHCVDIVDAPKAMYEPCTMQDDWLSGLDDCDLGLFCWDVDERGHGTCIGLCDGDWDSCTCADPKAPWPSFCQECAVGFCIPNCDPLLQDCVDDQLCIPLGPDFTCFPDASGDAGALNDPCDFPNACDKGLMCLAPLIASSACMQDASGCCQPFCNFANNEPCPNPDQSCVQLLDPMMPIPPGYEDVGVCAIPVP